MRQLSGAIAPARYHVVKSTSGRTAATSSITSSPGRTAITKTSIGIRHHTTTSNYAQVTLNSFITQPGTPITSSNPTARNGPLQNHTIAIKDNISTSSLPTTCASPGLRSYTPPYDATVVSLLLSAGASLAGKTNLDEFGMGSHSLHSYFGPVRTASGHSAGGSSGGSAVAVASGQCTSALGTDTGGSVRLPAAYNGVVGFKPSYGRVSRWGVVAYANSLDTVGFLGKDVATTRQLFEVCDVHDEKDPTSLSSATRARINRVFEKRERRKKLRIGVPAEYNIAELSPQWRDLWKRTLQRLQAEGHTIHAVSLPHTRQALSAYYVLAPAEASSNLAKYDGVRYGSPSLPTSSVPASPPSTPAQPASPTGDSEAPAKARAGNTLFTAVRSQLFGLEVRRRILLGAYTLSADAMDNYFIQAQRVRQLVRRDFDRVFALPNALLTNPQSSSSSSTTATEEGPPAEKTETEESGVGGVDILLTPTTPSQPPLLSALAAEADNEPLKQYTSDVFTVPASLAGVPAVSVPGIEGWGVQVIGQFGDDSMVLEAAGVVERMR